MNCHNPSHGLNSSYIFLFAFITSQRGWSSEAEGLFSLDFFPFVIPGTSFQHKGPQTPSPAPSPPRQGNLPPRLGPPAQGTPGCVSNLCGRVDRFPRVLHLDKQAWDPSAPRAILLCRIILPATAWAILPSSVSVRPPRCLSPARQISGRF